MEQLRIDYPNKPLYVSEFWPGWFDEWGDKTHHKMNINNYVEQSTDILFTANASINFYMFFGGTNFGFMAGGEGVNNAKVTSYDWDSPLSESGMYCKVSYILMTWYLLNDRQLYG